MCLQNETEGEKNVGVSGGVANAEKQIDEWLEQGIIRESCRDFSSPVVIGQQEDARGEWENLPPKTKRKSSIPEGELVVTVSTQFGNKMKPWTLH
ncbi:hypothetical protein TNCV_3605471 [Trichonephila clavipes]|uniref:Uncharacterized protein n=1 Tax=Trichonephila clavipes TaxID=2585209 RepID=A0A8X6V5C6_TRICX|nr:hypothetical protein TNCV_3605471 [Trichonephila clavipes]